MFTKSWYLLNRGLLNRGLGVCTFTLVELISQDLGSQPVLLLSKLCIELEQMDYISCPLDIIYDNPLLRKRIMILLSKRFEVVYFIFLLLCVHFLCTMKKCCWTICNFKTQFWTHKGQELPSTIYLELKI